MEVRKYDPKKIWFITYLLVAKKYQFLILIKTVYSVQRKAN